ncbi:sulfate adenylyltransferase, large subunit [Halobacteroides halobius DSM 5150]|uniref:sulfate adenylyltransferase n=1 Tax=Halobacteroides halobius (strain ATCC 35273 / DSM 5150 / MD-1) TaxID=748449 RepID=L0KCY5_HALHC|nr:GTP-binding protein [Halobacteroides halobius]AGB42244.1 sulfate adenylyltransferase, large subunit [Halobacteroides halobius DSM 5150]
MNQQIDSLNENTDQNMNLVIAGHVDHGKSTIIGRLLADTDSLPKGKLADVKETCRRNSKPFEYAFLLDALKDEQDQGITIDSARVFFETDLRKYIILDAPGHIEFLKNMVTGAARAEAALLVIDADEGIQENSKRHCYMLSMLGIEQVSVLVNKMDLVDYDQDTFNQIVEDYTEFLEEIGMEADCFVPVSGLEGANIATLSDETPWYQGQTVLEVLDSFENQKLPEDKPFRMPVQDVYKFTRGGDDRRIVSGTIAAGQVSVGDEVVFYPSGKRSTVKSIEGFNRAKTDTIGPGFATGFTLDEQIFIKRGELATLADETEPEVTSRIKTNLFWLGKAPLSKNKEYQIKLGTAKVSARLEKIERVIDASNLSQSQEKDQVERHDVAQCVFKLNKAIAFDLATQFEKTSRFVVVDDYEIAGGGLVEEAIEDKQSWVREKVMLRNYKWEKSKITREERAKKYSQQPTLVLITGEEDVGKKPTAKELEKQLFNEGQMSYFLGIGNLLYGVDADIKGENNHKEEHLRRLSEVSHIMLDAGAILLVTAVELTQEDLELIKTTVAPDQIETVWLGDKITTDIDYDLHISDFESERKAAGEIEGLLQDRGIIFRPW